MVLPLPCRLPEAVDDDDDPFLNSGALDILLYSATGDRIKAPFRYRMIGPMSLSDAHAEVFEFGKSKDRRVYLEVVEMK